MPMLPDNWAFLTQGQKDAYFTNKKIEEINKTSGVLEARGTTPIGGGQFQRLSPISSLSSEAGATQINTLRNIQTNLTGDPVLMKKQQDERDKAATQALADKAKADAENAKLTATFGTDGTPTKTPEQIKEENDVATARLLVDDYTLRLTNLDVSTDPVLQSTLAIITGTWNTRIAEMERVNKSRIASISTTGIRLGSRYTGGAEGMMKGIIAEEERQGVERVVGLEAQKLAALTQATIAFRDQKWKEYSRLVTLAENRYHEQVRELDKLNEATLKENERRAKEAKETANNNAVLSAIEQGFTDPTELATFLKAQGSNIGASEVERILRIAQPDDKLAGFTGDLKEFEYLKSIGDPSVKGLTWLEYKNAVYNATHKATTSDTRGVQDLFSTPTTTTPTEPEPQYTPVEGNYLSEQGQWQYNLKNFKWEPVSQVENRLSEIQNKLGGITLSGDAGKIPQLFADNPAIDTREEASAFLNALKDSKKLGSISVTTINSIVDLLYPKKSSSDQDLEDINKYFGIE